MRSPTLFFFFISVVFSCTNPTVKETSTNGTWRSNTSDSLSFSIVYYHDEKWIKEDAVTFQSYKHRLEVVKWYRYKAFLPKKSKWPPKSKKNQFFISVADGHDQVYLNGHFFGSNGILGDPIDGSESIPQNPSRVFELDISDKILQFGKENVIALRITGKKNPEFSTKNSFIRSSELKMNIKRNISTDRSMLAADSSFHYTDSLAKISTFKIKVGKVWGGQGLPGYDGYTWYRKTFTPSDRIHPRDFKIKFFLGKIDENDQIFFDGWIIDKNMPIRNKPVSNAFSSQPTQADLSREYIVDLSDKRIKKKLDHTIAIRVFDSGGDGGILSEPYCSLMSSDNFLQVFLSKFYRIIYANVLDTFVVIYYYDSSDCTFESFLTCLPQEIYFKKVDKFNLQARVNPSASLLVLFSIPFFKEKLNLSVSVDDKPGSNIFYDVLRIYLIIHKIFPNESLCIKTL